MKTFTFSHSKNVTNCQKIGCVDESHFAQIEQMYEEMIRSIQLGSEGYSKNRRKRDKFKVIPGWNRRVRSFYADARVKYLEWIHSGRNRDTLQYERMVTSRKVFKKALNDCKKDEYQEICNSIEEKYRNKNYISFWKEIKQKKSHSKKSSIIDGKLDTYDMLKFFFS